MKYGKYKHEKRERDAYKMAWSTVSSGFRAIDLRGGRLGSVGRPCPISCLPFAAPGTSLYRVAILTVAAFAAARLLSKHSGGREVGYPPYPWTASLRRSVRPPERSLTNL
jgi:hypothetical protein